MANSYEYARNIKFTEIGTDLFLYAIVKNEIRVAFQLLKNRDFKKDDLTRYIEGMAEKQSANKPDELPKLTEEAERCLVEAFTIAHRKKTKKANSAYFLMSSIKTESIAKIQNNYQMPAVIDLDSDLSKPEFANLVKLEKPYGIFG